MQNPLYRSPRRRGLSGENHTSLSPLLTKTQETVPTVVEPSEPETGKPVGFTAVAYDREKAVAYARGWALSRNPCFGNFSDRGGDCTNFASQAVYAATRTMDYTDTFGWYYVDDGDRAPAWTGVAAFYDFLTGSGDFPEVFSRPGPFGYPTPREYVMPGDAVQLANGEGRYYHTALVTGVRDGEIYVTAHSNDVRDRPLSSYTNASERFIHILGTNVPIGEKNPQKAVPDSCLTPPKE